MKLAVQKEGLYRRGRRSVDTVVRENELNVVRTINCRKENQRRKGVNPGRISC